MRPLAKATKPTRGGSSWAAAARKQQITARVISDTPQPPRIKVRTPRMKDCMAVLLLLAVGQCPSRNRAAAGEGCGTGLGRGTRGRAGGSRWLRRAPRVGRKHARYV